MRCWETEETKEAYDKFIQARYEMYEKNRKAMHEYLKKNGLFAIDVKCIRTGLTGRLVIDKGNGQCIHFHPYKKNGDLYERSRETYDWKSLKEQYLPINKQEETA